MTINWINEKITSLPMDVQLAFVILIALLTGSAIVVSVYVVFVLKDFRGTLKKTNAILDDTKTVTDSVKSPIVTVMGIADGIARGIRTARGISSLVSGWDTNDAQEEKKHVRK
ncbi:MAG: hypothetical protein UW36_C0001G0006 [candidate division WWE3 bacterium GW2011_GWA2_44_16]|uniref:DUF948 domain-containing protein n=4 Tax=Katanobacteria TaxID=422282 RepID=A0A0G1HGS4_UNCKA|nr:MAG: hypothetical protein UW36_C0001G0006 [candidate division WWE3 bacterium GW2011_GWA2_44_16]